jgi:hypothetical protein
MPNLIGGDCGDQRAVHRSVRRQRLRFAITRMQCPNKSKRRATPPQRRRRRGQSPFWGTRASLLHAIANEIDRHRAERSPISPLRKKRRHTSVLAASASIGATSGYFLSPALFTESSNDVRMNREKVFGPIACIISVRDCDEALVVANGTEFGLSLGKHFEAEREAVFPW